VPHSMRGAVALLVCAFLVASEMARPARADDEGFGKTLVKAAAGSAAGKGGEFAVKLLGGLIYDTSCNGPVKEPGVRYVCDVLGSVTGKAEEQWKAKVDQRLQEMSTQLEVLTRGQEAIARELTQTHKAMELEFDQAAQKVVATHSIVTIEGLWKKYEAEFQPGAVVTREAMVEFARNMTDDNCFGRSCCLTKECYRQAEQLFVRPTNVSLVLAAVVAGGLWKTRSVSQEGWEGAGGQGGRAAFHASSGCRPTPVVTNLVRQRLPSR
jgi:hypothetical protein